MEVRTLTRSICSWASAEKILPFENALVASMERVWMHRMTVVLVPVDGDWAIVSLQVTPVKS